MALDTSIITNAMAHIRANPSMAAADQESYLANAFKTFVEGATITYTAGLTTAAGGGPVSGTFGNTIS
jgi:hypothetical protein